SVPGAYVPVGQAGWFQAVIIRGGLFDQVGYEVDGVPVNRSFDNYPSSTASALGQQELQVYTGASPANAEGQGLSGFINQVVRTGTFPGFGSSDLGIGGPTFYHKANVEAGGASPDRLFSYYAGIGGYNQSQRLFDQNNGAGISPLWGAPLDFAVPAGYYPAGACPAGGATNANYDICYANGSTGPGGLIMGPFQYAAPSSIADRESVVNFHFALPHHRDGGRDDLQLLYQDSNILTSFYNSPSDLPASIYAADSGTTGSTGVGLATPTFASGFQYNGQIGSALPASFAPGSISQYGYPSQPQFGFGGNIPSTLRDANHNGIGIVKVQYQRNFGSDAYLRIYGYSLYSNWFLYGPNTTWANFIGPNPSDYELESHTRGLSATFAKQLNAHNLVQIQGSYTTATSLRDNNTQMSNARQVLGLVVNANNPLGGLCYTLPSAPGVATPTACSATEGGSPTTFTIRQAYQASQGGTQPTPVAGSTCGGGPCEWLAVANGANATFNTVTPRFTAASLTDEWDPTDRLHFNIGLRIDHFEYIPGATGGPARALFFNSWNNAMCYDPTDRVFVPAPKTDITTACSSPTNFNNANYIPATLSNTDTTAIRNVVQPRIGATFTINPQNVLRFSYGKYAQAPNAAFFQYNTLQQNLPDFIGPRMFAFGRTQPTYDFPAQISFNTDFSWEHQFRGTDASFKLTPFYRKTQDQVQQFPLDPKTGFVSGLNVGNQISQGVEFQLQKGDFARNGFAAMLSYTYTDAKIKYSQLSNGGSVLDTLNNGIGGYNAFTAGCAAGGALVGQKQYGQYVCGGATASANAAPCFTTAGTPVASVAACTAGSGNISNPYYQAPAQPLMDPNASYAPYTTFPGNIGVGSYSSFVSPHVATLVLSYKHDKFAVTPAVQYSAGAKYGYPLSTVGVNPAACTGSLTSAPDPGRYPYGAAGSAPGYDALTCAATVNIPNPDTGRFDTIGAFSGPNRLTGNVQLSYDISPRLTTVATLTNIFDVCSGGTKAPWTNVPGVASRTVCGYGAGGVATIVNPVGNVYNPGATIQPFVAHAYAPVFGSLPFNAYVDFK
ncbi:MAG: TonB-dependent receptor, partial [Candidatus Eremiobacteraeota bacterium]|nr:TonB-dependent receptor [Candidatus Eremiobacteraeota bacterium]